MRIRSSLPSMHRLTVALALLCAMTAQAQAAMYKCRVDGGRTIYSDRPCAREAKPWQPRNKLNTVTRQSLTGQEPTTGSNRPSWLKPIDPVGDCKRKGGRIDKELRACILP